MKKTFHSFKSSTDLPQVFNQQHLISLGLNGFGFEGNECYKNNFWEEGDVSHAN